MDHSTADSGCGVVCHSVSRQRGGCAPEASAARGRHHTRRSVAARHRRPGTGAPGLILLMPFVCVTIMRLLTRFNAQVGFLTENVTPIAVKQKCAQTTIWYLSPDCNYTSKMHAFHQEDTQIWHYLM